VVGLVGLEMYKVCLWGLEKPWILFFENVLEKLGHFKTVELPTAPAGTSYPENLWNSSLHMKMLSMQIF
jgi:hypothetical protein